MRRALILVAIICVVFCSANLLLYILPNSSQYGQLTNTLSDGVILCYTVMFILVFIVIFRQRSVITKQLRRYGIANVSTWQLVKMKSEVTRPYKREMALLFSAMLMILLLKTSEDVGNLILTYVDPTYSVVYPQDTITVLVHLCFDLGTGVCCLVYALLSKDLAKIPLEKVSKRGRHQR